jgi:hypothetical protein
LSLIGHAQFYISQRRRFNIRPYLNDKYKPICNSDVPLTNELFGNDGHKKIKELGDPTKIPVWMCWISNSILYPFTNWRIQLSVVSFFHSGKNNFLFFLTVTHVGWQPEVFNQNFERRPHMHSFHMVLIAFDLYRILK